MYINFSKIKNENNIHKILRYPILFGINYKTSLSYNCCTTDRFIYNIENQKIKKQNKNLQRS